MTLAKTHGVVLVESKSYFGAACTCGRKFAEGEGRWAVAMKKDGKLLGVCVDQPRHCHGEVPIIAAYAVRNVAIQAVNDAIKRIEKVGSPDGIKTHPFAEQPREVPLVFA